jgi:A/G-specific adenine glycosylase
LQNIPWLQLRLLSWFSIEGRLFPWRESGRTPYELVIAEILLQRTTANSVAKSYQDFLKTYPSWSSLARTQAHDLQKALKPFGLWQQKSQLLTLLAQAMEEEGGNLPSSRIELEQLAGIGQYIASTILTVVYGKAEPFLDVNMARVLERFFGPRKLADIRDDAYLQTLSRKVVEGKDSLALNWAILDLAALICKPGKPNCTACPLQAKCRFNNSKINNHN